jgi:hypothetical protein
MDFAEAQVSSSDPRWQLPVYMDQVRRLHVDLFSFFCRRTADALGRIGAQPDWLHYDLAQLDLALRSLRLALMNFEPPVGSVNLRSMRRDKLLELFKTCAELLFEWLRGWGEPWLRVSDLKFKLQLAAPVVEMVCLIIEQSDLAADPKEFVVNKLSSLIDYASSICGDGDMRERDEDVTMSIYIANTELAELAMPMIMRLSGVHAVLHRHFMCAPAALVRDV